MAEQAQKKTESKPSTPAKKRAPRKPKLVDTVEPKSSFMIINDVEHELVNYHPVENAEANELIGNLKNRKIKGRKIEVHKAGKRVGYRVYKPRK